MVDKREIEKSLEYARGYHEALVNTWEEILKMATKGYSSHEVQIVAKTKSVDAIRKIEHKILELESLLAQEDIIDVDEQKPVTGLAEEEPIFEVFMSPRMSYLVKEPKPARCYEMLQREIAEKRPAMIIARTSPELIRERYDIGKSKVVWLTMNEKITDNLPPSALGVASISEGTQNDDEYVKPGELPKLYSMALNFIDGHENSIILFEGIEYLVSHSSFQSLMNFLQKLNEDVVQKACNLVISANPTAFEPKNFSNLESEMSKIL